MGEINKKDMTGSIDFEELARLHEAADLPYGVNWDRRRTAKAKQKKELDPAPLQRVIDLTNVMLGVCGYSPVKDPVVSGAKLERLLSFKDLSYSDRESKYEAEFGVPKGRFIWMKFSQSGHVGVVAAGADINFDAYDRGRRIKSDMFVKACGLTWDTSYVLVFPLPASWDVVEDLHVVETLVGNYLIASGVPIIDCYSHNYSNQPVDHNIRKKYRDIALRCRDK